MVAGSIGGRYLVAVPRRKRLPRSLGWLFPEHDLETLDALRDRRLVLSRILERGRMVDVEWCFRTYGLEGIRDFFHSGYHPEISPRTERFWRVVLDEKEAEWPKPPDFRRFSAGLWRD